MRKIGELLLRTGAAFLVFLVSLTVFWVTIAFAAYRVPAFQDRRILIGHTYFHKVELGLENRSLFERLFSNGLMRLEGQDEPLYVSARLHQTLWPDNADDRVSYQVKVAATPLLFGEFSVAQVISAERIR